MTEAKKSDEGKPRFDLLPMLAIERVARVMGFGAAKYGAHNYLKGRGLAYSRLIRAGIGHLVSFAVGRESDDETGESHLAHAACTALMLLELVLRGKGIDDRFNMQNESEPGDVAASKERVRRGW